MGCPRSVTSGRRGRRCIAAAKTQDPQGTERKAEEHKVRNKRKARKAVLFTDVTILKVRLGDVPEERRLRRHRTPKCNTCSQAGLCWLAKP